MVGRLAGEMTWHCLLGWVALLLRCVRACTPFSWNRAHDRSSSWESRRTEREREREREMGPKREVRDRPREREIWNEAGVALSASLWLAAWLFAWPFACVVVCLPSIRFDAGVLVCSLASLCLQRQGERERESVCEREREVSVCCWLFGWLSGPRLG